MEDKRVNLESEKRKKILDRMVEDLSREHMDFYYLPAIQIARVLHETVQSGDGLNQDELDLLRPLTLKDIHMLLSYR